MKTQKGFTLIELLVTLLLVVIVSGVMYSLYKAQNQTTVVQSYVSDMQQTLRASAEILSREIRMAGYNTDPLHQEKYGITKVEVDSANQQSVIEFTADLCENGGAPADGTDCVEIYSIKRDGNKLYKANTANSHHAIAENVEEFELCYSNGEDPCEVTPDAGDYDAIREVILSILVKSAREDNEYKNTKIYKPGSHKDNFGSSKDAWGPADDGYHRRMIVKRIKLRNMGL